MLACASTAPAPTPSANHADTIEFRRVDLNRLAAAICEASNEVRWADGSAAIPNQPILTRAAARYARRLAELGILSHRDRTGGPHGPNDRVRAAGGRDPVVVENLASAPGYPLRPGERIYTRRDGNIARSERGPPLRPHSYRSLARTVVRQWLRSPAHRKTLLRKDARQIGCGAAMFYNRSVPWFVAVQTVQLYEALRSP